MKIKKFMRILLKGSLLSVFLSLFLSYNLAAKVKIDFIKYNNYRVQVDVYNPHLPKSPAIILIHGAAGLEGDRAERYEKFATDLMNSGFIAIVVHYFDTPQSNWIETIIKTIDYAEKIDNVDREKIGMIGYSLGGTLALQVSSYDSRIKLLAINSGYLPHGFTKNEAKRLPKIYFSAGSLDSAVNTLYTLKKWFEEENKPFVYSIVKGYGHSVPLDLFWEEWDKIVTFFKEEWKK